MFRIGAVGGGGGRHTKRLKDVYVREEGGKSNLA